jgi:murein L,D-transpeptidase YcbB/YkuD
VLSASRRLAAYAKLPRTAVAILLLLLPVGANARQPEHEDVAEALRSRIEQLRTMGSIVIGGEVIRSRSLLLAAYETRGFQPLWESDFAVASLVRAITAVWEDGLHPGDYHVLALRAAAGDRRNPAGAADLDILCTDALLRVGRDLRYGKTEPLGPASEPKDGWASGNTEAVEELVALAASGRVEEALATLRPRHFVYTGMRSALSELRWIQTHGGWEAVPFGPMMRRDSVDDRVPLLRARLALEGDYVGPTDDTSRVYDAALEAAVRSFQYRHGLNEDGLVERVTLAALAVPVEDRIDQLRVNLERARWVGHELPPELVAVNIAGARVYLLRGDSIAFETRAVVGADATRTPVFAADMRYVVLNPTWTVPTSIVGEVLGLARADPEYLRREGMRLFDPSGKEVDAAAVDLTRYTAVDFPYVFRQDPGPANALGRIKLMLPNPHHVYLHDTPSRALFMREERLFSHGCIRIQDPLGLTELVLGDPETWNREALEAAIATGGTRTIPLARPVPVFVLYWTAGVDALGTPHFYPDVYGRDAGVLAALDAPSDRGTRPDGPR